MKYKRIITGFSAFLLCFNFTSIRVKGEEPVVDARYAIAMDAKSRIVLYEKGSDKLVPIASTTKIITSLVAIKYGKLDEKIEISANASGIRGSTVGFKKGEKIMLRELLYGLMLRSGNDAAIAIAEGTAGSVENFAKLMNEYSSEIGLLNSHFESPHGLDSENHYSTAYDLAIATAKAKENKIFNDIVASKDIDAGSHGFTRSYHNINKILYQIPEADGVKTGYTGGAGKCLVTSIKHNNNDIIIVVLNCTPRWKETEKIYDYIIKNYKFVKMFDKNQGVDTILVNNKTIPLKCTKEIIIPQKIDSVYSYKIIKPTNQTMSVKKGDNIGKLIIIKNDKEIYSQNLISDASSIIEKPWWKIF